MSDIFSTLSAYMGGSYAIMAYTLCEAFLRSFHGLSTTKSDPILDDAPPPIKECITGQLYKQFALTIAVSTAFSGFNALTFTPAMCALFLTPRNKNVKNVIYRVFNKGYAAVAVGMNTDSSTSTSPMTGPVSSFMAFSAA